MSKVVYISGIPYDQTEEQVLDIASSVGPVVTSKLLFDKQTGKSRGVCLVEYQDYETASSAVRNLNNYTVQTSENGKPGMGNRYLKCNFAGKQTIIRLLQGDGWSGGGEYRKPGDPPSQYELESRIPPLPAGMNVVDSSADALNADIYRALTGMGDSRLRNLVRDAKIMSNDNPELMEVLLDTHPQLMNALVQAAMLLNMANPDQVKKLLSEGMQKMDTSSDAKPETVNASQGDKAKGEDPNSNTKGEESSQPSTAISGLSEDQIHAIKQICSMTDEQIEKQITDKQQRKLYAEIRRQYAGVNL